VVFYRELAKSRDDKVFLLRRLPHISVDDRRSVQFCAPSQPSLVGAFACTHRPIVGAFRRVRTRHRLRGLPKRLGRAIDHLAELLSFEPTTETRNRKPLKRPIVFMATWEIRFGPHSRFRIYYDVDLEQTIVSILAIGSKHGDRVVIGREEIQL
jgi:hypothetical protein